MTKPLNPDAKKQAEAAAIMRDHVPNAVKMANLQLRLATELQLWEAEQKDLKPLLVMLAIISFMVRIAVMDRVPKNVVLAVLDSCTEWDEEPRD